MRFDVTRKLARNRALVAYRDLHPDFSWTEIAQMYNVSRQRARIIYARTKVSDAQRTA